MRRLRCIQLVIVILARCIHGDKFRKRRRIRTRRRILNSRGIELPSYRYVQWEYLDLATKQAATTLTYTEQTWNQQPFGADIEHLSWESLSLIDSALVDAAKTIGFNQQAWDCYINHYEDTEWELLAPEIQIHYVTLGWDQNRWYGLGDVPEAMFYPWNELPPALLNAASELCYFEQTWDQLQLQDWTTKPPQFSNSVMPSTVPITLSSSTIPSLAPSILPSALPSYQAHTNSPSHFPSSPASESPSIMQSPFPTSIPIQVASSVPSTSQASMTYTHSAEIIEYPNFRYITWKYLDDPVREAAALLTYTEESWNAPATADIEFLSWTNLGLIDPTLVSAATTIGFTQEVWDCFVNHYEDNEWDSLALLGVQHYFEALGWTEDRWIGIDDVPENVFYPWNELPPDQLVAARQLCYIEQTWERLNLNDWTTAPPHVATTKSPSNTPTDASSWYPSLDPSGFPSVLSSSGPSSFPSVIPSHWPIASPSQSPSIGISLPRSSVRNTRGIKYPSYRYIQWRFLDSSVRQAATILTYSEESWNEPFTADIEFLSWRSLGLIDSELLEAAKSIGFSEDVWNCYINHYDDNNWAGLAEQGVQQYFKVLGWDEKRWIGLDEIPETIFYPWIELTMDQQAAARELCYIEETWDLLSLDIWTTIPPRFLDTPVPSFAPSPSPSDPPTTLPTMVPSQLPTVVPSLLPSEKPSSSHTSYPTATPSSVPTPEPTNLPSRLPTAGPSVSQSVPPSEMPSTPISLSPTNEPLIDPKREPTSGPSLPTAKEPLRVPVSEIEYPSYRYVLWEYLNVPTIKAAIALEWQEATWDAPSSAAVERLSWDSLGEDRQQHARTIGFSKLVWDCYVNHYGDYDWKELAQAGIQQHFVTLGWTELRWNGLADVPPSEKSRWGDLTVNEQTAAAELCYFKETWNDLNLAKWTQPPRPLSQVDVSSNSNVAAPSIPAIVGTIITFLLVLVK